MTEVSLYKGKHTIEFDERKHAYKHVESGLFIPGVTTILRRLDKPALVQWAANMAVQYIRSHSEEEYDENDGAIRHIVPTGELDLAKTAHRRASKEAADIGTIVHDFAERVVAGERVPVPADKQARKGCDAFVAWHSANKIEPISLERIVYSDRFFYAGTCDGFGHINGELCVWDYKTSSGLYLEMLLQLAAYQLAIEEEEGAQIDAGYIIRLDKKTGKFEPYRIPFSNRHRDAFIHVLEAHKLLTKIEDEEIDGLRKQAKAA